MRTPLVRDKREGVPRQLVGLEISWTDVEKLFDDVGLAPQIPGTASRTAVPLYYGGKQAGKATTTSWSPLLKKMLALGSVKTECAQLGTKLQMELTVEAVRHTVTATVVQIPFYNPARKTAVPV